MSSRVGLVTVLFDVRVGERFKFGTADRPSLPTYKRIPEMARIAEPYGKMGMTNLSYISRNNTEHFTITDFSGRPATTTDVIIVE